MKNIKKNQFIIFSFFYIDKSSIFETSSQCHLEKLTEYYDNFANEDKNQPKIMFSMKILNPKLDKIAKDKNQGSEKSSPSPFAPGYQSGSLFANVMKLVNKSAPTSGSGSSFSAKMKPSAAAAGDRCEYPTIG